METYRELIVWRKAFELVELTYAITRKLPTGERYGLVTQMQRAAVSIPSNIAEGKKRGTKKDFSQFLRIAGGSAAELETQLLLTQSLYHTDATSALNRVDEIQRMLTSFIKKLE